MFDRKEGDDKSTEAQEGWEKRELTEQGKGKKERERGEKERQGRDIHFLFVCCSVTFCTK